jgi:hypothetical protein
VTLIRYTILKLSAEKYYSWELYNLFFLISAAYLIILVLAECCTLSFFLETTVIISQKKLVKPKACRHKTRSRDSSVGIATGYGARRSGDQIPVGARFFTHIQTGPGAHPVSCTMGTGSFLGVKRSGGGVDHTPPSSAEVTNEYLYFPSGPSVSVMGRTLLLSDKITFLQKPSNQQLRLYISAEELPNFKINFIYYIFNFITWKLVIFKTQHNRPHFVCITYVAVGVS